MEEKKLLQSRSDSKTEAQHSMTPGNNAGTSADNHNSFSIETCMHLLKQVFVSAGGTVSNQSLNSTVELFESMKPTDAIEAALISQILTVHNTAMDQLNQANKAFGSAQADAHRSMAIKLMNLLTKQVAAFRKYRTGGDQRIKVEHVNIEKAAIGKFTK